MLVGDAASTGLMPDWVIGGDGKPDPDVARAQAGDRGVHPHDPPGGVDQWAAGVAGVDRRVGLDGALPVALVAQAVNFRVLQILRQASFVVLPVLLVLSLVIGWWLAGRVLRPVRRVTTTAREIGATDLSRRIALDGPRDEIRSLADPLDDMLGRLDGAFTAQRRLIDDASHELRHPLAVIRTTLDAVLSRDDAGHEERRHATAVTARATDRMTGLVEDLLAAARRAAPAFVETDVDLAAVVRDAADEHDLLAAGSGVRIERAARPVARW
jgi:signal transduction histidine kinase